MDNSHSPSRIFMACLAAASLCLQTPFLFAADFTWDGGEGDGQLMSGNNWTGDIAPSSGNTVAFSGNVGVSSGNGSVNNDFDPTTFIFGGIDFENDFALAGNIPFILGGNLIRLNGDITTTAIAGSASGNTINDQITADIELQGNSLVQPNAGHNLQLRGDISENGGSFQLEKFGDGSLQLHGTNTFSGGVLLREGNLQIFSGNALGTGNVTIEDGGQTPVLDIDAGGLLIENDIEFANAGGNKAIRFDITGSGEVSEISGNITFSENNANQSQIRVNSGETLVLSGDLLGGNGFIKWDQQGGGILSITGNNSAYNPNDVIQIRAGTLRMGNENALGEADITLFEDNQVDPVLLIVGENRTYDNSLTFLNQGAAKTLRVESGTGNATYSGTITLSEATSSESRIGFDGSGDGQELTVSGLITGTGGFRSNGDGTLILTNTSNDFAGDFLLGDGGSSVIDSDGDGANQGIVIVDNIAVLGTSGSIVSQGSQLRTNTADLDFTQDILIESGGLRLGGTNDFELSGNVTRGAGGTIGNYGLDGVTITMSGDIDIEAGGITLAGSDGKDNGEFTLSGIISDGIAGNSTNNSNLTVDGSFDGGDVTVSGVNTFTGRTIVSGGTLHISQEENIGSEKDGGVTEFDADRLEINASGNLNTTASFTIDDADRGVEFNGGGILDTNAGTTLTVASNVSGTGMTKVGSGNVILSGNNSIASIDIQAGSVLAGSTTATATTTDVIVGNSGTLLLNGNSISLDELTGGGGVQNGGAGTPTLSVGANNGTATFDGVLSDGAGGGTLALTKIGTGTQTLTGDSTYTGATLISSGQLTISGNLDSAITVGSNGTLAGEGGTSDNLTFNNGGTIDIDASNGTTAFTADGTVDTTSGNVTVNVSTPPTTSGDITVFNYGTFSGNTGTDFDLAGGVTTSARGASFTDDVANTRINLNLGFENKTWVGGNATLPTTWDIGISNNWTGGTDNLYQDGDFVTFNDTGIANNAVILSANQTYAPASITFENTLGDYTISNGNVLNTDVAIQAENGGITVSNAATGNVTLAAKITGSTAITHDGTGTLFIGTGNATTNVSNDYTGLVTVKSGATLVDNSTDTTSTALGSTSGRGDGVLLIEDGATFDINGNALNRTYGSYGGSTITLSGNGVDGLGALVNNPSNTTISSSGFGNELLFVGNTTLGGSARFDIDTLNTSGSGNYTITKEGSNTILIQANNNAASITDFVINNGILGADNNNNALGNATVTVNSGGSLSLVDNNRNLDNTVILNGGRIRGFGNNQGTELSGNLIINANSFYNPGGNASRNLTLSGNISGTGRFEVEDDGTLFIAETLVMDDYSGAIRLDQSNARLSLNDGRTFNNQVEIGTSGNQKFIELTAGGNSATLLGGIEVLEGSDNYFLRFDTNGGNLTVAGNGIIGTGDTWLQKLDSGTLVLSADNSAYLGDWQVLEGTIQVGDGGTTGTLNSNPMDIASGAFLDFNRSDAATFDGAVSNAGELRNIGNGDLTLGGVQSGVGTITQNGAGILTLSGNSYAEAGPANTTNSFLGNTNTNSGTLNLTGEIGGNISMAAGTTFSGEGTVGGNGTVTFGSGGNGISLIIDASTAGNLTLSGGNSTLDVSNGTQTVFFSNGPTSAGDITVLSYAGNLTGSNANFVLDGNISTSARGGSFTDTGSQILLNLGGLDRTWSGNVGGTLSSIWDGNNTAAWQEGDMLFVDGDFVTFDDTAGDTLGATGNVTVVGNLMPASITFSNFDNQFTLTGNTASDSISAASGITISGNGAVTIDTIIADPTGGTTSLTQNRNSGTTTLSQANTYTGGTTVSQGNLFITNSSALGTGNVTLEDLGTTPNIFLRTAGLVVENNFIFSDTGGSKRISVDDGTAAGITGNLTGLITLNEVGETTSEFVVGAGDTLNIDGKITGVGGPQIFGNGSDRTVRLNNAGNDFTGRLVAGEGITEVASIGMSGQVSHAGAGNRIVLGRNDNDGTLSYTGSGNTTDRQIQIGNRVGNTNRDGGGSILNNGTGALIFTANNFNAQETNEERVDRRFLTLGGNATGVTNEIRGTIRDNRNDTSDPGAIRDETVGIIVSGSTWSFSGNNTYGAGTTVQNGGTLLVEGGDGTTSGTGLHTVVVESGGTLGGSGFIGNVASGNFSGAVTIEGGGIHTAGTTSTAGSQTVIGDISYEDGATLTWNLMDESTVDGSGFFDQFNVGGELDFNSSNTNIQIVFGSDVNFGEAGFWDQASQSWQVWDLNTLGGSLTGFDAMNFTFLDPIHNGSGTAPVGRFSVFEVNDGSLDGNGIYIGFTGPIPEPSTYALFGLGLAGFGWFAHRRKRKQSSDAVDAEN